MTEILRCPLVPEVEPEIRQRMGLRYVAAIRATHDWQVYGSEQSTDDDAIAVWNEAMRGIGAKEGEG